MTKRFSRLACALALCLLFASSTFATDIIIAGESFDGYNYGGSAATVRFYASDTFTASDGRIVAAGTAGSTTGFFRTLTCAVSGTTLTCPSVTLPSTTDSLTVPTATWTAVLFDHKGTKRDFFPVANFKLPHTVGNSTTWAVISQYQGTAPRPPSSGYLTADQTLSTIASSVNVGNPATTAALGRIKLNLAPADAASPIAVGANDPRLNVATTTTNGIMSAADKALLDSLINPTLWRYSQPLAVRNVSGVTLTGAQLRVSLTSSNFTFSQAKTDGGDIRFTDDAGNFLHHYKRSYNSTTQTASFDVVLPTTAAGASTTIYLYWGNQQATSESSFDDTYAKASVDATTSGLWHLDEGTGSSAANSVGGGHALTLGGSPTWSGDTAFTSGGAVTLNGTSQYIEDSDATTGVLSSFPFPGSVALTWKPTNARGVGQGGERLLYKANTQNCCGSTYPVLNAIDLYVDSVTGKIKLDIYRDWAGSNTFVTFTSVSSLATSWTAGAAHRLLVTWDASFVYLYIDGVLQGRSQLSYVPTDATNTSRHGRPFTIGARHAGASGNRDAFAAATFDEIKVLSRYTSPDAALADYEYRTLIPVSQIDKWVAPASATLTASEAYEGNAVLEPSVVKDGSTYYLFYTAVAASGHITVAVASSSTPTFSSMTKHGNIVGWGTGGAGASEHANSAKVVKVGSTWHVFAGTGYSAGGFINHYTSSSPTSGFSKVGVAIPFNALPNMTHTGNFTVYPVQVGGVYHAVFDGFFSDTGLWSPGHATSTDLNTWTIDTAAGRLTSLKVDATGMYGGVQLTRIGSTWHAWYHYTPTGGYNATAASNVLLPGLLAHATSTDAVNWTVDSQPVFNIRKYYTPSPGDPDPPPSPDDQIADAEAEEFSNLSYLYTDNDYNGAGFKAAITVFTFNGTLADLTTTSTPITFGTVTGGGELTVGATTGTCTLASGTCTVTTSSVTGSSLIFLSSQSNSVTGALRVSARTPATSFVITSSSGSDSGSVAWQIIAP